MPPLPYGYEGGGPPSTSLTPTSDNRGIPQRKAIPAQSPPQINNIRPEVRIPSRVRQVRSLTVDEALQYSPLSSIMPFDSRIVPMPHSDIPFSQPIFPGALEKQNAMQILDHLDASLLQGRGQSVETQQVLNNVKSLLNAQPVPEFRFKIPQGSKSSLANTTALNNSGEKSFPNSLGPFANMVLNATNVVHRYPTPKSPSSPELKTKLPKSEASRSELAPALSGTTQLAVVVEQNQLAYSTNAQITTNSNALPTPQKEVLHPMIMVPPLPPASDSSKYMVYEQKPVFETKSPGSKKRKRDDLLERSDAAVQTNDQRALSNTAVEALRTLVSEIFEAEEHSEVSDGQVVSSDGNGFFVACDGQDGAGLTLIPAIHVKLETSLHKAISVGRFRDIPVEHLSHLHKLCRGAFMLTETTDIAVHSDSGSDEASGWLDRVETIELGFRSARTVLRIMAGGREEKEVYSEELLQKVFDLLCKVIDSCIVPVVESRSSGAQSEIFEFASTHKRIISQLLHSAGKIMQLLSELVAKEELTEATINSIEFFVLKLLFVENAQSEKESVLGTLKFEAFRRIAMKIITEIFSRYPEQRRFVLDEILTSLQKLPTTRQHARQFKLSDGKSMQLVSALLMRLVQTSGMHSTSSSIKRRQRSLPNMPNLEPSGENESGNSGNEGDDSDTKSTGSSEDSGHKGSNRDGSVPDRLIRDAKQLYESSVSTAQYVVNFFVTRASTASKTGDQPHRHLLDIFTEDLIAVLSLPEWPASELLLRALVTKMDDIVGSNKSTAPAKNMALETLGVMGSAISDITATSRHLTKSLENDNSNLSKQLIENLDNHFSGSLIHQILLEWTGPYRTVLEYLQTNGSDLQSVSAQGYYLTQWTKNLLWGNHTTTEPPEILKRERKYNELAIKVCRMLASGKWFHTEDYDTVSTSQCRLAYLLTILNMGFCRAFSHILKVLLESIGSDQISVRTRSLKSVTQMLEKDPSLLDRTPQVIRLISNCASDQSSMVRDSALVLIGKCILLKPAIELEVLKSILARADDTAVGIRKRSLKLLKDIYLRNPRKDIRAAIADSVFQRAQDLDESVADLARQIFEEIWLAPFCVGSSSHERIVQDSIVLKEQVVLVIQTVRRNEKVVDVLILLLRYCLGEKSKNVPANTGACKAMINALFDGMVDSTDLPEAPEQQHVLHTLTVFSRACPKLFNQQQLEHLLPYIASLATADDLNLFRSVVIVLRCVLPTLSAVQKDFLKKVQDDLLKNVSKLAKAELDEVVACLWTINGELHNIERLVNLQASVLTNLYKFRATDFMDDNRKPELSRIKRFLHLAGHFTKHCDFQPQLQRFKAALPFVTGDSVSASIVDCIMPFTNDNQPIGLRSVAFDSIGMICQSWPKNFTRPDTSQAFQSVLRDGHPDLQRIVLSSFRDFFATQDPKFEETSLSTEKDPLANGQLGGSMTASEKDGAAALIAQGFLKDVLRIALASQDSYALTATEVIASITRQGLVHPKECGPALVALETSTNSDIAEVAFQQHRNLHQQHESMFEREYIRAIHEAFLYQRDIVHDTAGFLAQPFRSKLHLMYEIVKTSKSKYQAKFLSNFCDKINFDITTLDHSISPPPHLQYARFLIENLAFFDYGRVEDVLHATSCMEKIAAGTGAGIAHMINTEVFQVKLDPTTEAPLEVTVDIAASANLDTFVNIEPARLFLLATASMILSMLWEARTFVRRLYGINSSQQRRDKAKALAKDLNKVPTKASGVTGDKLVASITRISRALDSRELMLAQCKDFAELMSIDNEVKIAAEAEDDDGGRLQTPSADDEGESLLSPSGGSKVTKRKGSLSAVGDTPHKKKRGRPSIGGRKKSVKSINDEEDPD